MSISAVTAGSTTYAAQAQQMVQQKKEEDTKAFYSSKIAVLEEREKFKPNDKDRYTVVVWIEGDDPDCTNDLLGGEVKLHMDITEEHVNEKKYNKE